MHKKAKHSKFKNAGILFELLTRQITSDILAGRDESFTKNLMFKYFHESKELGKEAQLYNFILQQSSKDENSADRILTVVLQTRSKLDERELNKQKYNIIKEIKEKYNIDEFLKNKIPNYKLYASVYKLFENQTDQEVKFDMTEILESREYVVENLTKEKKSGEESLDVYGSQMSLKEVAALATPDPKTITIQPWDRSLFGEIEKAILAANLGLTPMNDGKIIRINMPPLTEERRKDFVKQISKEGEAAKVAVRNIRRDSMDALKKDKALTEDDQRRNQDEIQKLTDQFIQEIDKAVDSKTKEVMTI